MTVFAKIHKHLRNGRIGSRTGWYALFFGLYWLLVAKTDRAEILAGLVTAGLALAATVAMQRQGGMRFAVRWEWIALLPRLLIRYAADCMRLAEVLWRTVADRAGWRGRLIAVPFDVGGKSAQSAARRALVVTGISWTPNTIAVVIDREKQTLLIHQLMPEQTSADREWLL